MLLLLSTTSIYASNSSQADKQVNIKNLVEEYIYIYENVDMAYTT